jgi:glucans biosynthesis protein
LNWLEEHEPGRLCKVTDTRRGFAMDSDDHLYVVEFTQGVPEKPHAKDWLPDIDVTVSGGAKVLGKQVMPNPATQGWRAFFRLDVPPSSKLLEMSCELKDGPQVISERWMYQWRQM